METFRESTLEGWRPYHMSHLPVKPTAHNHGELGAFVPPSVLYGQGQEWNNAGVVRGWWRARGRHLPCLSRWHLHPDTINPSILTTENSKSCDILPMLLLHLMAPTSHFVQKDHLSPWLRLMLREEPKRVGLGIWHGQIPAFLPNK